MASRRHWRSAVVGLAVAAGAAVFAVCGDVRAQELPTMADLPAPWQVHFDRHVVVPEEWATAKSIGLGVDSELRAARGFLDPRGIMAGMLIFGQAKVFAKEWFGEGWWTEPATFAMGHVAFSSLFGAWAGITEGLTGLGFTGAGMRVGLLGAKSHIADSLIGGPRWVGRFFFAYFVASVITDAMYYYEYGEMPDAAADRLWEETQVRGARLDAQRADRDEFLSGTALTEEQRAVLGRVMDAAHGIRDERGEVTGYKFELKPGGAARMLRTQDEALSMWNRRLQGQILRRTMTIGPNETAVLERLAGMVREVRRYERWERTSKKGRYGYPLQ